MRISKAFKLNDIMDGYLDNFVDYDDLRVNVDFEWSEYKDEYGADRDGNRAINVICYDNLRVSIDCIGFDMVKPEKEYAEAYLEKWFDKNFARISNNEKI